MPGRLFLDETPERLAEALSAEVPEGLDLAPRFNIAPGQEIVVCPADRRLTSMRWGIVPVGRVNARGRPVMETLVNVRGETMGEKSAFEGFRRCVVPASGWYEWTGEKRRKQPWRIRARDGSLLVFAALWDVWRAPGGRELAQVATVTCEPSGDVRDIHHRMGVLLDRAGIQEWLSGDDAAAAALVRPWPDGTLTVDPADGVDWSAP